MALLTAPPPMGKISLPSRSELRAMLSNPWIAALAIVCAVLIVAMVLGAVVFLAYAGKDSTVITALLGSPALIVLLQLLAKVRTIEKSAAIQGTQTPPADAP